MASKKITEARRAALTMLADGRWHIARDVADSRLARTMAQDGLIDY
jgi:hypothetical protein